MQKPDYITITGVDAKTPVEGLLALTKRYPIEWGILFSPKLTGKNNRYPLPLDISAVVVSGLTLSAHLCGGHSNIILNERHLPELDYSLMRHFRRFQFNTRHGEPNHAHAARAYANLMRQGGIGILQCRESFPMDPRVHWLYDRSGGRGVAEMVWPTNAGSCPGHVGYAGGISPDNVGDVLAAIGTVHPPDKSYWIDMETGVRTNDWLDLEKVERVCQAIFDEPTSVIHAAKAA